MNRVGSFLIWFRATAPKITARSEGTMRKQVTTPTMPSTSDATAMPLVRLTGEG